MLKVVDGRSSLMMMSNLVYINFRPGKKRIVYKRMVGDSLEDTKSRGDSKKEGLSFYD